jgi:hypothetical protein
MEVKRNKRGQIMSLYLPILTLFMCGLVVALFYIQHKDVASSLVSPTEILKMSDNIELFKIVEQEKILDSITLSSYGWGSENYADRIKDSYCSLFSSNNFSDFLFEDIYYLERGSSEWIGAFDSVDEKNKFCEEVLYDFVFENNQLTISRNDFSKRKRLVADNRSIMNFPIVVEYSFASKYLITNLDNKFELEEI